MTKQLEKAEQTGPPVSLDMARPQSNPMGRSTYSAVYSFFRLFLQLLSRICPPLFPRHHQRLTIPTPASSLFGEVHLR